jgi:hypothetical protein
MNLARGVPGSSIFVEGTAQPHGTIARVRAGMLAMTVRSYLAQ